MTLRGPNNPGITMVNSNWIAENDWEHLRCDTPSGTLGANTAGVCFESSSLSGAVTQILNDIQTTGFYTDYILGEHTVATSIRAAGGHNCLIADIRGSVPDGNTVTINSYWSLNCVNAIAAGTTATTVNINADVEGFVTFGVNDPSSLLTGIINWNVPYNGGGPATPSNLSVNGGLGLQLNNLHYGNITISPSATASQNGTISFGANFGTDAIDLFASGALKYGWGLNAGEMQFFMIDTSTDHWSYNAASGGLQATGTNEYFRMTPRTSGGGLTVASAEGYCFSNSTTSSATPDTCAWRLAPGIWSFGGATAGDTGGFINAAGTQSAGTKFTTSGCSVSSTTGGATAGIFTLGANSCTVVITMNGATGLTATNGWTCQAHDRTTAADLIAGESSSTTTTASIVIPVTAGATDVISFSCVAF